MVEIMILLVKSRYFQELTNTAVIYKKKTRYSLDTLAGN